MKFLRAHTEIYSQMASGRPLISNPGLAYSLQVWDIMTSLLVYDQLLPKIYKYMLVFRVTWSLVLCVCLVDHCLSFCTFSFGHCLACSSLIYRFWLPPFGIFKLFFYHQHQFTTYVYSLSLRFLCCVYVFYANKS